MAHLSDHDLDNRYVYHPPTDPMERQTYEHIRSKVRDLAEYLNRTLPESDETRAAFLRLDEVMFFSNAAVARHGRLVTPGVRDGIRQDDVLFTATSEVNPEGVIVQSIKALHRPTGISVKVDRRGNGYADAVKDPGFVDEAMTALQAKLDEAL